MESIQFFFCGSKAMQIQKRPLPLFKYHLEIQQRLQILIFNMQANSWCNSQKQKNHDNSDFELSQESYQSDVFDNQSECLKREKKLKIKLRKERIYKKMNRGSWSTVQEEQFLIFLHKNRTIFEDREQRRSCKIFRKMRSFIKTRSHEQCRSHHQKYEQRFLTFDGIVEYLQTKVEEEKRISKKTETLNPNPPYFQQFNHLPNQKNSEPLIPHHRGYLWNKVENQSRMNFPHQDLNKSAISEDQEDQIKSKVKIQETKLQVEILLTNDLCRMIYTAEKQFVLQMNFQQVDSL